ncbi:hypothetical protein GSI_05466 [Ganoderma sinense ZZ0214-1]|uniref:DUF6534 domain-containing protein n=1 Tax=Ganoderma sinense ZZ0214-1 TaxID=1077348 RepID=A0A2G8SEP1_9APHY|nr:hypothetical protein GSI_05466 [Ganoderma sinense ZZ0214-1]
MATSNNGTGTAVPVNPLDLLPKIPPLDNTFGAVLIGTFIGLLLYGITLHQSYRYFRMYPADLPILKCLVSFVLVLETVSSALSMHVCYRYLVTNYFHPQALMGGEWSLNLFPLLSGVIMVATQSFFIRRVWILGRQYRYFLAIAVSHVVVSPGLHSDALQVALCFVEMGFFIAATVEAFVIPTFKEYERATWLVSTGSTMAVSSDILITAMLITALRRSRTGIKRTDSMLDVMIMYSINTGLLTGIANLGSLLFAFIQPGTLIWAGVGIPGVKMYANTLMAALNSRRSLAAKGSGNDISPFGVSGVPDSSMDKDKSMPRFGPPKMHSVEEWQVKSESTAQRDSVVDIVPPGSKSYFSESIHLSDIERQDP